MDLRPNSCPNMRNSDGSCLDEQSKTHKYKLASVFRANDRPVSVYVDSFNQYSV